MLQNMFSDTYVALWDMIYDRIQIVTCDCKGLQTQIGLDALQIGRALQDVVSI